MALAAQLGRLAARVALTREQRARLEGLQLRDAGHGWDRFGASEAGVRAGLLVARHMYDFYFRVSSHGATSIPAHGPTIVVSNHSGTLPFDAIMLWADILLHTDPPRLPRPVADYFVPMLPFVSTFFARAGMVAGSRRNVATLLEAGELLEVFPEGVAGIGKHPSKRYQLQRWTVGHAEFALRHRACVLPVAVIGPEEQWPQLGRLNIALFGAPYVPLMATPVPLPVRYHIHYGEPIDLCEAYGPNASEDPRALEDAAERTRDAVAALIQQGLDRRSGVFT